jgi:hypothetical protein
LDVALGVGDDRLGAEGPDVRAHEVGHDVDLSCTHICFLRVLKASLLTLPYSFLNFTLMLLGVLNG